jgi:predicted nucleotidyltransferase
MIVVSQGYDRELLVGCLGVSSGDTGARYLRSLLGEPGRGSGHLRVAVLNALVTKARSEACPIFSRHSLEEPSRHNWPRATRARSCRDSAACEPYGVRRLVAFGSAVTDHFDGSTGDVGFLVEFRVDVANRFDAYFGLKESLEALLGRAVDLFAPAARNA